MGRQLGRIYHYNGDATCGGQRPDDQSEVENGLGQQCLGNGGKGRHDLEHPVRYRRNANTDKHSDGDTDQYTDRHRDEYSDRNANRNTRSGLRPEL
jgi:hypothetical protein